MKRLKVLLAAVAWTVTGAGVAFAQVPAACPPEPMRVVRSRGGVFDYLGTVANVPDLCRMRRPDGLSNAYYGVWRSEWPGAGDAYPALKNVVLGGRGTRIDFFTRSFPGMQWIDSFINEGVEPMVVDGVPYSTLRIAHERKGIEGNTYHSIITSWRDIATGATLRTYEQQISGQSYGPDTTWTAVKVMRLSPGS